MSEPAAFVLEEVLVERFGRKILKNGNLLNLQPGGKWPYPKVTINSDEKTSFEEIQNEYPELIEILKDYPHIATESQWKPWWIKKIPKRFAIYQYSIQGEFMEVHNTSWLNSSTGMNWRIIDKCIKRNRGYAFGFQWSRSHSERLEDLTSLSSHKLIKLREFNNWRIRDLKDMDLANKYKIRNQEVETKHKNV